VTVSTNDDVIVHLNTEATRGLDNSLRHFNIGLRRRRIASGMIVQDLL
jgi:hypothetical protein